MPSSSKSCSHSNWSRHCGEFPKRHSPGSSQHCLLFVFFLSCAQLAFWISDVILVSQGSLRPGNYRLVISARKNVQTLLGLLFPSVETCTLRFTPPSPQQRKVDGESWVETETAQPVLTSLTGKIFIARRGCLYPALCCMCRDAGPCDRCTPCTIFYIKVQQTHCTKNILFSFIVAYYTFHQVKC